MLERLLRMVMTTEWALMPETMAAFAVILERRLSGERLTQDEIEARIGSPRNRDPQRGRAQAGSVAILPLRGVIAHRASQVENVSSPRGTSVEAFREMFNAAINDPKVSAIVIDVDSPGGAVNGVQELAAEIVAARGTKPVVAVANTLMASAAYWIASAADEIVAAPSADVGSIGVYTMHMDQSAFLAERGIKPTFISSEGSPYKTEGNPFEPLSEDAQAFYQSRVDATFDEFVRSVAIGRGVAETTVRGGYGGGRTLKVQDAKAAGMVDEIATLEAVIARLGGNAAARPARVTRATGHADLEAMLAFGAQPDA